MKRSCANSANVNLQKWDEPSYGNGSPLNMRWHILDTGRDDVLAIEAPAKISLICDAAPSFTIYMSLLVPWLSRTLPDYLTDVLAACRRERSKGLASCTASAHVIHGTNRSERTERDHRQNTVDDDAPNGWKHADALGLGPE